MFQKAQLFHNLYVNDKSMFVAAFPHFVSSYETDFQTVIDTADDFPSNYEVKLDIVDISSQIAAKMVLARVALQKLFSYTDVAFRSNAKTKSFGRGDYMRVRNSHRRMKDVLEKAHRLGSLADNRAALNASGYSDGDIAALHDIADELANLASELDDLKSLKLEQTELRIKAYNAVWKYMAEINQASKVVFPDSPAKLTQYLLYLNSYRPKAKETPEVADETAEGADEGN